MKEITVPKWNRGFDLAQSDMCKGSRLGRKPTLQSCGLIPPNSSEPVTKDRNNITKIYDHKSYTPERCSLICKTAYADIMYLQNRQHHIPEGC